jgi:hypothetical protein
MTRSSEKLLWTIIGLQLMVIAYLLVFSSKLSARLDVALMSRPVSSSPTLVPQSPPTLDSVDVQQLRAWWQQDLAEALSAQQRPASDAAVSVTEAPTEVAEISAQFDFTELDNQLADLLSDGLYSNVDMGQIESAIAELPSQHRQKAMNRVMRKLSTENIVISQ